jgi:hypothetical protein
MKWIAEGRPLAREVPRYPKSEYPNPAQVTIQESAHSKKMPWRSATRAKPSSTFDCPEPDYAVISSSLGNSPRQQ